MKEEQSENLKEDIKSAENQYFANIKHDKDQVWDRIEKRLKKNKTIPFWIYYAAASILLVLSMGFVFNQSILSKNKEIAELKLKFESRDKNAILIQYPRYKHFKLDTIQTVKERLVQVPVNLHDTLYIYDTIQNIVVQMDTVYIRERKKEDKLMVENQIQDNKYLENGTDLKKKRNRRFIIQFGKPKTETTNTEQQSLLTLRTK